MPTDTDTKVFDIARQGQNYPNVNTTNTPAPPPAHGGTPIHVAMSDEDESHIIAHSTSGDDPSVAEGTPEDFSSLTAEHYLQEEGHDSLIPHGDLPPVPSDTAQQSDPEPDPNPEPDPEPNYQNQFATQTDHDGAWPQTQPLPTTRGAGPYRRWPKVLAWLLVGLILVVVGGYLAIDAGLVSSNIKLPFHIFNKQKTSNSASSTTPSPAPVSTNPAPAITAPTVPAGFTAYSLSGTNISFDYPTAWGAPVVTTDSGFSQRGGATKSTSTYAYLVNFAVNKDVQMAFTSSKYLPTTRTALYYDYLQWCLGTVDGKFYKQSMHFTTVAGIDTPANVVCDQGPLSDATKIDNQTIVQPNTKDVAGKALGDLYTQNLTDASFVVLRIKDATMQNGTNIKTLLTTVKVSSAASSSSTTTTQ